MLTIITATKPFVGPIGMIQRNAIRSWTQLSPRPQVILFGTEAGVAECAAEFGLRHIPEVARNGYGTPLLSDIFAQAERASKNPLFAYVNGDIILTGEFMRALAIVQSALPAFLAVGRRTNLDVREPLDFSGNWEESLKARVRREGVLESHTGIDLFAFPRGTYREVPALAIGRVWFDQWCIKYARKRGIPVVDITGFAPSVHQIHDYGHVAGGKQWVYGGPEADENLAFYGERPHTYTILSSTHGLTASGRIRRYAWRPQYFMARNFLWKLLIQRTFPLRNRLGLRRSRPEPTQ